MKGSKTTSSTWIVKRARGKNGELRVFYRGESGRFSQVAALHDHSGYLRLAPGTGWGTSVVLPPILWSDSRLHQGAPLHATWQTEKANLAFNLDGVIAGLQVRLKVLLRPPRHHRIQAQISAACQGEIALDCRLGEAFKPVLLSSMRVSPTHWDADAIQLDRKEKRIADIVDGSGWILSPEQKIRVCRFGFRGGDSGWKRDAPSVQIRFAQPMPIAAWQTRSDNPNDDNLALWAACDHVLESWNYTIIASHPTRKKP